ncbi:hypothetical protein ACH4ZX_07835 [Streptomyces sp. NPDC020490]|uniref:hypothetical protein n=1 Tax=Streptomyces sp. NPDC020490 TaxID=3365078 RepID=UPI0037B60969
MTGIRTGLRRILIGSQRGRIAARSDRGAVGGPPAHGAVPRTTPAHEYADGI